MKYYSIKDCIDNGLVLALNVVDNKYEGLIYGKEGYMSLSNNSLVDLDTYEDIRNLLNNSNRIIKISGGENYYILQLLDIGTIGDRPIPQYILVESLTANNLSDLLENYNNKIRENKDITI